MSKPNETTKDFSKVAETMVANAINSEIDFLLSDLNITPKTKIRILVKLEDLRHQTFVRGIKNTSIMI